jgi:hypothetical protein
MTGFGDRGGFEGCCLASVVLHDIKY